MHYLQNPGYCCQRYHWRKLLKHSHNLFTQWQTTHIICYHFEQVQWYTYFSRNWEGWNTPKWHFLTVLEKGENPWIISKIWFHIRFMILLWRMSSFLSWDFSPTFFNSGSTLSVFVVLVCAQHSCKVHWYPLWVFILCFISISWFPLNLCEAYCQKKGVLSPSLG